MAGWSLGVWKSVVVRDYCTTTTTCSASSEGSCQEPVPQEGRNHFTEQAFLAISFVCMGYAGGFPGYFFPVLKNPLANAGVRRSWIPGSEDPRSAYTPVFLSGRVPWTKRIKWAKVHGVLLWQASSLQLTCSRRHNEIFKTNKQ